jgi:3-deoxy-D-manno-octulosonic-acid transferase
MRILYSIGLSVYLFIVKIAALRNPKAKLWLNGRKRLLKRIKTEVAGNGPVIWVHCASLGEFEQGRPLIEEIKRKFPEKKILLTFYSPSGYELQKNYSKADFVYYLPLDKRRNARRFIKYINPEKVFFIKYEYWFNYLSILKKKKIPVYFVSAIFRQEQLFFKRKGRWYRKLLKKVTHFFVQNPQSERLLKNIGIENVTVCGDTRFDRVAHISDNVKPLPLVDKFVRGRFSLIVGSSWKAEDALVLQYIRTHPNIRVILAPHEVNAENLAKTMQLFGDKAILYSNLTEKNIADKQVLVIDCYGLLTSLYQYGNAALVGGGFGVGIHNVLEPATFGMPIIFGPNYERFREAVELVEQNCAFPVHNIEDFNVIVNRLTYDTKTVENISKQAAMYVIHNVGATMKIIDATF